MYGAAAWQAQSSTMHAQPRTYAAASLAVGPLHSDHYPMDPSVMPSFQAQSSLVFPDASSQSPGASMSSQSLDGAGASGPPFYWVQGGW